MHWLGFGIELLVPLGIGVYTINFGRWMWRRQQKPGAIGAYVAGVLSFASAALALWHDSSL